MNTLRNNALLMGIAAFALTTGGPAQAKIFGRDDFSAAELSRIRVSMPDAIARAQIVQPGTPVSVELEEEGDRLVYEVELNQNDQEKEVKIDAVTGEVLARS